jgi:pimeloyl-ACP methyl ester carboxylesterase
VLVTLARRLAEAGLVAFLIDYVGTGDSEGAFEEGTLDRYEEDILAAVAYLRAEAGVRRCGLLGLRLGGNLASRAAARDPSLSPLVLWAGLADVPAYFRRFLRLHLFTELSTAGQRTVTVRTLEARLGRGEDVDVLGYPISPAMAQGFLRAGPEPPPDGRGPTLVLAVARDGGTAPGSAAIDEPPGGRAMVYAVGGEPFWERARVEGQETACRVIVDWVRRAMAA